jgi:hypothetical protein
VAKRGFDLRAVKPVAGLAKEGGIELGAARGKGGYEKALEEQVKRRSEFAEKTLGRTGPTEAERREIEELQQIVNNSNEQVEILHQQRAEAQQRQAQAESAGNNVARDAAAADVAGLDRQINAARNQVGPQQMRLVETRRQIRDRGRINQQQYASTLGTGPMLGIPGLKVPRKNKIAAEAIRRRAGRTREQRVASEIEAILSQPGREGEEGEWGER